MAHTPLFSATQKTFEVVVHDKDHDPNEPTMHRIEIADRSDGGTVLVAVPVVEPEDGPEDIGFTIDGEWKRAILIQQHEGRATTGAGLEVVLAELDEDGEVREV